MSLAQFISAALTHLHPKPHRPRTDLDPKLEEWRQAVYRKGRRCAARSKQCRGPRNAHHIKPVNSYPELVYDVENGVTFCAWHHLHVGHGGMWSAWVPNVLDLAEEIRRAGVTCVAHIARAVRDRVFGRLKATK